MRQHPLFFAQELSKYKQIRHKTNNAQIDISITLQM